MLYRVAVAFISLVALQTIILTYLFFFSGVIKKVDDASYNAFVTRTPAGKNSMVSALQENCEATERLSYSIGLGIKRVLSEEGIDLDVFGSESSGANRIEALCVDSLITFLKSYDVTGAFVVIDGSHSVDSPLAKDRLSVYIRNLALGQEEAQIELLYGRNLYAGQKAVFSTDWNRDMDFSDELDRNFYYKPIAAAKNNPLDGSLQRYGFWNPPFRLSENGVRIVTYSLPLVLNDSVCGVVGFELNEEYIGKVLSLSGAAYDRSFNVLAVDLGEGLNADKAVASSMFGRRFLEGSEGLAQTRLYENVRGSVYKITNINSSADVDTLLATLDELPLYSKFSDFYGEKWLLCCFAPEQSVMSDSNNVKNAMVLSVLVTVILALGLSVIVVLYIYNPIRKLAVLVRSIDPEKPVIFDKTGIREVDDLTGAFEALSAEVSKAAAKMFGIIELVNMPIGSFEINYKDKTVHLSKTFFGIMGMDAPDDRSSTIVFSTDEWDTFIDSLEAVSEDHNDEENITETLYTTRGSSKIWLRSRKIAGVSHDMGVIIDVTDEITQKQRLEYERDADPLTKLLNRRAFTAKALELLSGNANRVALLMFADLDGLKSVNDLYGHDFGDAYLLAFTHFLNKFKELRADVAVGRMSGDEFVVLLSGFLTKEAARNAFDSVYSQLANSTITLPDGSSRIVGASVGLAYYPFDSTDIDSLIKYADYAMYGIKRSSKGAVAEFAKDEYYRSSLASSENDVLSLVFEKRRIHYVYQPIADARTGEVYAYEALMRPDVREFKSPAELLKIARSQSMLYHIEKLTLSETLRLLDENRGALCEKKVFINSLQSENLSQEDIDEIDRKHAHLFGLVVLDIVDSDFINAEVTKKNLAFFRERGALFALPDHGRNPHPSSVLPIKPDFIKIDRDFVRDVDNDSAKRVLVESIIAYSAKRGIKVVAVGVETSGEMKALIEMGVDYLQGFYIAKPDAELIDIPDGVKSEILASI